MDSLFTAFSDASMIVKVIIIVINLLFGIFSLLALKLKSIQAKIVTLGIVQVILFFGVYLTMGKLSPLFYLGLYLIPNLLIGFLIYFILRSIEKNDPANNMGVFDIMIKHTKGRIFANVKRGVSVQGAAGSGKTASVAGWILYWFGKRNVPGVFYDYKEFELVELVQHFYKDSELEIHCFAPYNPQKSIFINFLAPEILKQEEDIELIAKSITSNVIGGDPKNFFTQAAEGAITGVIYVLRNRYPDKCNFGYMTAIFSTKDVDELVAFIEQDDEAAIKSRAFLDSKDSERQMAGVKASLSTAFKPFLLSLSLIHI